MLEYIRLLNLGFLVVGYNPLLCVRQNVGDGLSGSDELSFFKSTPPQFPITRSYYYGVGEIQSCHFECGCCPLYGSFGIFTAM